jgi:hypothetical protein
MRDICRSVAEVVAYFSRNAHLVETQPINSAYGNVLLALSDDWVGAQPPLGKLRTRNLQPSPLPPLKELMVIAALRSTNMAFWIQKAQESSLPLVTYNGGLSCTRFSRNQQCVVVCVFGHVCLVLLGRPCVCRPYVCRSYVCRSCVCYFPILIGPSQYMYLVYIAWRGREPNITVLPPTHARQSPTHCHTMTEQILSISLRELERVKALPE